ncbi:MAG: cytochrome P450, partial [Rhodospirillaceae bacterium]
MTQLSSITPKPDHVPPDRVFDFDFYHPETLDEDIHVAWKRLHSLAPDVFWTPRNGGHWIATRAADIRRLQLESNNFSHKGLIIPYDPNMLPHPPTTTDPPEHAQYRALILPAFTPRAIASLEGRARAIAIDTIERLHPRGECEFIDEFAKVLPITVFLEMVDLPFSDRDRLLPLAAAATRSQTTAGRHAASIAMAEYLTPFMRQRLETPGKDLISHVVNATLFGRPIAFEEALMALVNLL